MDSLIQVFQNEHFGKIRVLLRDGEPWFVAADVCRALELGNTSQAMRRLRDNEKQSIILPNEVSKDGVTNTIILNEGINNATSSGWIENRVTIVNEPGFYRLVFSSRKEEAEEFQNWVYHEVLPAIRKTGSYSILANPAPAPVHVPNPNRVAGQFKDARVYAIGIGSNAVKIGQSCNVAKRKSNLKSRLKVEFGKTYQTALMPRKIARAIEKACHDIFSASEHDGEIFFVEFEAACRIIIALEKLVGSLPLVSDFERGQKLLEAAKMMGDIPERQAMILNATNLIAGKNED